MKRIVVLGQSGAFGRSTCADVADRLAQRLGLPRLASRNVERSASSATNGGWIAVESAGPFSLALFRAADTAVWLHYSAWQMVREWANDLRHKRTGFGLRERSPRLGDVTASVQHMLWTPHVLRWLQHPSMIHLHVHHLRSPAETDFWLRTQDHRLPRLTANAQPA